VWHYPSSPRKDFQLPIVVAWVSTPNRSKEVVHSRFLQEKVEFGRHRPHAVVQPSLSSVLDSARCSGVRLVEKTVVSDQGVGRPGPDDCVSRIFEKSASFSCR